MKFILRTLLPNFLYQLRDKNKYQNQIIEWEKQNKTGASPHLLKQNLITHLQLKSNYSVLVETGTYLGEMVDAQKKWFKKIISIELDYALYKLAFKRFNKVSNIKILNGDSARLLKKIVNELDEPAIFWLDGHYSGGVTAKGVKICPIYEELDAILGSDFNHIVIIDDLRLFVGKDDYPTISELGEFITRNNDKYSMSFFYDCIILNSERKKF